LLFAGTHKATCLLGVSHFELASDVFFAKLAQLTLKESVGGGKIVGELLANRLVLLQDGRDKVDLLPHSDALLQALVDLLGCESELLHKSASRTISAQGGACEERFHEETEREVVLALEREQLDSVLELGHVDIVAVVAQVAVHNALEHEAHPLFERASVGVEQRKVEVEVLAL